MMEANGIICQVSRQASMGVAAPPVGLKKSSALYFSSGHFSPNRLPTIHLISSIRQVER